MTLNQLSNNAASQAESKEFVYRGPEAQRLDKYLAECFPEHSRSRVQIWIRDGHVQVNRQTITKTGAKVETGDTIHVAIPPIIDVGLVAEDIPLAIVYEDNNLVVINKPAGMVVHPSAGHASGTMVQAVMAHAPELEGIGGEYRPGVVHRLDKDTSGLIMFAKNDRTLRWLQKQFKNRQVEKYYLTLVDGHLPTVKGRIEAPVSRDPSHRQKMAVVSAGKGKHAVSEYEVIEEFAHHSLVRVRIFTGRTHQIRLHMQFMNCPVAGDQTYGKRHSSIDLDRQFLHAAELVILLEGEDQPRHFSAPLPNELQAVLQQLR
jgi:23S rRNA pseudouridine1911/1915/1917 synthase